MPHALQIIDTRPQAQATVEFQGHQGCEPHSIVEALNDTGVLRLRVHVLLSFCLTDVFGSIVPLIVRRVLALNGKRGHNGAVHSDGFDSQPRHSVQKQAIASFRVNLSVISKPFAALIVWVGLPLRVVLFGICPFLNMISP